MVLPFNLISNYLFRFDGCCMFSETNLKKHYEKCLNICNEGQFALLLFVILGYMVKFCLLKRWLI